MTLCVRVCVLLSFSYSYCRPGWRITVPPQPECWVDLKYSSSDLVPCLQTQAPTKSQCVDKRGPPAAFSGFPGSQLQLFHILTINQFGRFLDHVVRPFQSCAPCVSVSVILLVTLCVTLPKYLTRTVQEGQDLFTYRMPQISVHRP